MDRKDRIDAIGAVALVGFATVLAFNQIVVKISIDGFQPVFMAALRSGAAVLVVSLWVLARGKSIALPKGGLGPALLLGSLFGFEFFALFLALDWTSVARASILFYSMPVHLALAAHFLIPGERMTGSKALGLALALGGVAWVIGVQSSGEGSLLGDLLALLAAVAWAGIALIVRITPLADAEPEVPLWWQLMISAVILFALAPFCGPLIRDLAPVHWAGLVFQVLAVASFGYLFWFFLLKIYPTSGVASFSFLSPVLSVFFAWLMLNEAVGWDVIGALVLVTLGLILINRPAKS